MSGPLDPIDDDRLGAFVDGELSPAEFAAITAAASADPALAARIERVRALRAAVAVAFAGVLAEPPPSRLLATVQDGAEVVDLGQARARRALAAGPVAARWGAIAASLALAFFAGRAIAPATPGAIVADPGGLVAAGPLADSLEHQLASNQPSDGPVKIGVSFQASDGAFCRTFALRRGPPLAGLACRDPGGWRVRVAAQSAPPEPERGGYQTAGDEMPTSVLEAVDQAIRGAPFDAAAEAKARAAGWRMRAPAPPR